MIVLDTHVWLWWSARPTRLSARAAAAIARSAGVGVPAISVWELGMLAVKARIRLDRPIAEWVEEALDRELVSLLPLTPAIALRAASLAALSGDPADRLIAATALEMGLSLVTKDERLHALDGLTTVW